MTAVVVLLAVAIILLALVLMALMATMRPAPPRPAPLPARLPVAARRPAVVIDVEARPAYGRRP